MATARFMLSPRARVAPLLACLALAFACTNINEPDLVHPTRLVAPYPPSADVVWVVAPLSNESGSSLVDELAVTDELVNQIRQVQGLSALPTNRALAGMRALNISAVRTPQDALELAAATGADATLVGTITAWNPYEPLELGMTLALFPRTAKMQELAMPAPVTDPIALRTATREQGMPSTQASFSPSSSVADHADASNHAVLADAKAYAYGRSDPRTALGWQVYVKSMKRYTEFVCYRLVGRLLADERTRLTPVTEHDKSQ